MTEEQYKKMIQNVEKGLEQKKEILEQGKAFHQQLLFCSTTVFSVIITFNQQKYLIDSPVFILKISTLTLLLLNIVCLTILLYQPFRSLSKAHVEFMRKLEERLHNPSVSLTVKVQPSSIELFSKKIVIALFVLAMISLLIFGIMSSLEVPCESKINI